MLQLLEAAGHVTPSQIAQARGIARTALPASRVGDGASESKYCELCAKRGIDGCQCGSMGIAGLIAELEQQGDPVQYIEFAQDGYQRIADVFTEAFKPTKRLTGAELVGTVCELIRSAASTQQDEQRNGGKK
ncbi:hypothetical protein Cmtc_18930 [Cupriavidus sp. TKC]|uniref:hypothetical protein n=1 Tax=Cupriavidus sp. TKC TaxID=2880159 RepID=UPI0025A8D2E9|nr:hypothetical protein [Cupriavidus sp. TKC]GMG90673.1 hypothetical protein Cmtc_18930 [Cupriavidus sp. TKC]